MCENRDCVARKEEEGEEKYLRNDSERHRPCALMTVSATPALNISVVPPRRSECPVTSAMSIPAADPILRHQDVNVAGQTAAEEDGADGKNGWRGGRGWRKKPEKTENAKTGHIRSWRATRRTSAGCASAFEWHREDDASRLGAHVLDAERHLVACVLADADEAKEREEPRAPAARAVEGLEVDEREHGRELVE